MSDLNPMTKQEKRTSSVDSKAVAFSPSSLPADSSLMTSFINHSPLSEKGGDISHQAEQEVDTDSEDADSHQDLAKFQLKRKWEKRYVHIME